MFYVLMPAVVAFADLEDRFIDKDVPARTHRRVDPDEPPPLLFDKAPGASAAPFLPAGAYPGRWAPYTAEVRSQMNALVGAIVKTDKLDDRDIDLNIAVWVDQDGHVSKVRLDSPSGNPILDAIVSNDARTRLILPPPPPEMPLPIKLKIVYRALPAMAVPQAPPIRLR